MKLAIVGAGMIAKELLSFIGTLDCEVKVICATKRNVDNLIQLCEEHDIERYYTDYDEMLEDDSYDTVYLGVPNYLHYRYALKAIQKGKHVICEKPFTSNCAQLLKLRDEAEKNHVILIEAITTLYFPLYQQMMEMTDQLGDIKIITMNYTQYSSRYNAFKQGDIKPAFDVNQSGGALMDLNIYNIHFVVNLFGRPQKVNYLPNFERGVDTSGILTLDYPDYKAVLIAAKDCGSPYVSAIQGNRASIHFDGAANEFHYFDFQYIKQDPVRYYREQGNRMSFEFRKFIEIIDNRDFEFAREKMKESIMVMEVIDAAKASAGIRFPDDEVL